MRKVLVLTSSYPAYAEDASGIFVKELAGHLSKDFDIHILAPYSPKSKEFEVVENVKVHRYKYWIGSNLLADGEIMANLNRSKWLYFQVLPFVMFQLFHAMRILIKFDINIIHAHWLVPQGFTAVVCKILMRRKLHVVGTVHGGDVNNFKGFWGSKTLAFVVRFINRLTVVSNAIKDDLLKLGIQKEILVYPMGVNTELFSPDKRSMRLREQLSISNIMLLFVGGISHRKGIEYLIKAMPQIRALCIDVKLVVVGDGNLLEDMKLLSNTLGVKESIIFLGKVPHNELPAYFASADLFVLPSFSEGFGLVYAEALSCETIAIASNLPPVRDIITEGKTGFFLAEVTSDSIAQKVSEVLNNKDCISYIKPAGRQHVVRNFDWSIVSRNYSKLFSP